MHARGWSSIVTAALVAWASPAAAETLSGVASVIDGDTLEIHGERIRLHGIDAPESGQHCRYAGTLQRCGQQAANALAEMIGRQAVRCEGKERDRYGRLIAVCYSGEANLNASMVRSGWALAYVQYSRDYVLHEQMAAQERQGMWRYEFDAPWDYRRGVRNNATPAATDVGRPAAISGRNTGGGPDRDCRDFRTRAEAQAFFEAAGPNDPHRLDGDGDGRVCERLP